LPGNAGLSSRRCHGLATRGVRADRVGVALSFQLAARRAAARHQERGVAGGASRRRSPSDVASAAFRPLARETSAGDRLPPGSGASASRPGRDGAARARCRVRRLAGPRRRCGGRVSACLSRSRRRRAERAERASARWLYSLHSRRGSGDPVVVLAGWFGCRSRRAALGPGPQGPRV